MILRKMPKVVICESLFSRKMPEKVIRESLFQKFRVFFLLGKVSSAKVIALLKYIVFYKQLS